MSFPTRLLRPALVALAAALLTPALPARAAGGIPVRFEIPREAGSWRVFSAEVRSRSGSRQVVLAPGTHYLIYGVNFFAFTVDGDGAVRTSAPFAAGSPRRLEVRSASLVPVRILNAIGRKWSVYEVSLRSRDGTIRVLPGDYWLRSGLITCRFSVAADGTVETDFPYALGGANRLELGTGARFVLSVRGWPSGAGQWQVLATGDPATGDADLGLIPGRYLFRHGGGAFEFEMGDDGSLRVSYPHVQAASVPHGSQLTFSAGDFFTARVSWPYAYDIPLVVDVDTRYRFPDQAYALLPGDYTLRMGLVACPFTVAEGGALSSLSPLLTVSGDRLAADLSRLHPVSITFPGTWRLLWLEDDDQPESIRTMALPEGDFILIQGIRTLTFRVDAAGGVSSADPRAVTGPGSLVVAGAMHPVAVDWPGADWTVLGAPAVDGVVTLGAGDHLLLSGLQTFRFTVGEDGAVRSDDPAVSGSLRALALNPARLRPVTVTWPGGGSWWIFAEAPPNADAVRTVALLPGRHLFQYAGNQFRFEVTEDGTVSPDYRFAVGGPGRLDVGGPALLQEIAVDWPVGQWYVLWVSDPVSGPGRVRVFPGAYVLYAGRIQVPFEVDEDGQVTTPSPYASGGDHALAMSAGEAVTVEVTWDEDLWRVDGHDWAAGSQQTFRLLPGRHTLERWGMPSFDFEVGPDASVSTRYPYAVGGAGTLAMDRASLRPLRVHWPEGQWQVQGQKAWSEAGDRTVALLPGDYQLLWSDDVGGRFTVGRDGRVSVRDGRLLGGTDVLSANPAALRTIRIEHPAGGNWMVWHLQAPTGEVARTLTALPGSYIFERPDYTRFAFTVGDDGTVSTREPGVGASGAVLTVP